jgi:L-fuculose-phosphate aldolase
MSAGSEAELRAGIVAVCRAIKSTGLSHGTSGNVSARRGALMLITPSGVAYDTMSADNIVALDLEGGPKASPRPSSEWRMHAAIYRARPEAGAVVHTHSDHATALSCLRQDIPAFHYMVARFGGSDLRCAPYRPFGSAALAAAMMAALDRRTACLLANHGQICFGASLDEAFALAGEVETLCRHYVLARQAGEPVILGEAEMAEVMARFAEYGQRGD